MSDSLDDRRSIWLASYPRSGNTMLRYLLNQVFDLKTTSLYDGDTRVFGAIAELPSLIGHYDRHKDDGACPQNPQLIKTHEEPLDSGPAIYIVRDGRAALVSYMYYLRRIDGATVELPQIIRGEAWPGSWSDHFLKWSPLTRPNTLLLRYEDMIVEPDVVCSRLADFIRLKPLRRFRNEFSTLQAVFPQFFHRGENSANIAELESHLALFESLHSDLMKQLGYYACKAPPQQSDFGDSPRTRVRDHLGTEIARA